MSQKRKIAGGIIGLIGFMLSPLSWWNDLFVNVPLALAFAWAVSLFYPPAFGVSFVVGYWLTNVLGLVLMHHAAKQMTEKEPTPFSRQELIKDLVIALLYTLLIVALVKLKLVEPLPEYLPK